MEIKKGTTSGSGTGGITIVTDGVTTVTSATELTFTGATVSNLGGGNVGVTITGGTGSPGGLNTQIQYNNNGVFGGITGATTDGTIVSLNAPHLLNPTINGAGAGLATLTYPNTATSVSIAFPATAGTVALTSQLTSGTVTSVATNATLTGGTITTTGTLALNLSNANTWAALQTFGTNISIGGITATGATGTGNVVFATSPTVTSPTINTSTWNPSGTSAENFTFTGRAGITFPVPFLTAATNNTNIAFDLFPKGTPGNVFSIAPAWFDLCSTDIVADGTNYECVRLSKQVNGVSFLTSSKGGTGSYRDMVLQYDFGNNVIAGKLGVGIPIPTANVDVTASTTGASALRIRSGSTPTSPNTGDLWFDGTHLQFRNGATTNQLDNQSGGTGLTWNTVTGTTQAAAISNGYITNNASLVTVTLPSTAAVGSVIELTGQGGGGWKLAQPASVLVNFGSASTTTGTGGSIASTNQFDSVRIVCIVANTTWNVLSAQGNLTIV